MTSKFIIEKCDEFIAINNPNGDSLVFYSVEPGYDSCSSLDFTLLTPSNYKINFYPMVKDQSQYFFVSIIDDTKIIFKAKINFQMIVDEIPKPYINELTDGFLNSITINEIHDSSGIKKYGGKVIFKGFFLLNNIKYSSNFGFEYIIKPEIGSTYLIKMDELLIELQTSQTNDLGIFNIVNKKLNDSNLNVFIEVQTNKLGLDLSEMYCMINSNKYYPNGYPQKYRGKCVGFIQQNTEIKPTYYSFKPNLQKVLKLEGNVLYDQTKNINNKYNTNLNDCEFYSSILVYSTLRYIFAGLSNNSIFSIKWLYSNNYYRFLKNLENSEFSEAVTLFTEPQKNFDFTTYNKYYKKCKCKK